MIFDTWSIMYLDINECDDKPCSDSATCTNTEGSYTCECKKGFTGDGVTCHGKRFASHVINWYNNAFLYMIKHLHNHLDLTIWLK